ncbi:hypothetical protein ACJJTC_009792 [Scirpophaga incertulas]
MRYEETESEIEDEVDMLMSSDIVAAQMSTKEILFLEPKVVGYFEKIVKNHEVTKRLPVKIDIPILPTVSAKITFEKFDFCDNLSPNLFIIPDDYMEDPQRFPDL